MFKSRPARSSQWAAQGQAIVAEYRQKKMSAEHHARGIREKRTISSAHVPSSSAFRDYGDGDPFGDDNLRLDEGPHSARSIPSYEDELDGGVPFKSESAEPDRHDDDHIAPSRQPMPRAGRRFVPPTAPNDSIVISRADVTSGAVSAGIVNPEQGKRLWAFLAAACSVSPGAWDEPSRVAGTAARAAPQQQQQQQQQPADTQNLPGPSSRYDWSSEAPAAPEDATNRSLQPRAAPSGSSKPKQGSSRRQGWNNDTSLEDDRSEAPLYSAYLPGISEEERQRRLEAQREKEEELITQREPLRKLSAKTAAKTAPVRETQQTAARTRVPGRPAAAGPSPLTGGAVNFDDMPAVNRTYNPMGNHADPYMDSDGILEPRVANTQPASGSSRAGASSAQQRKVPLSRQAPSIPTAVSNSGAGYGYGAAAPLTNDEIPAVASVPTAPVPEYSEEVRRVPCSICGRSFAPEALSRHQTICRKASSKTRRQFNAADQRTQEFEVKPETRASNNTKSRATANGRPAEKPVSAIPKWKRQHENFQQMLKAGRVPAGGAGSGPAPPMPAAHDDRTECPHCGRKFAEEVANRHIPHCATQKHKPAPPPHMRRPSANVASTAKARSYGSVRR